MIEKVRTTEALKRVLNDEIAAAATAIGTDGSRPQLFYCECQDLSCVGRVEIRRLAYRELRRREQPLLSGDCLSSAPG